jgi:hypothetical protein
MRLLGGLEWPPLLILIFHFITFLNLINEPISHCRGSCTLNSILVSVYPFSPRVGRKIDFSGLFVVENLERVVISFWGVRWCSKWVRWCSKKGGRNPNLGDRQGEHLISSTNEGPLAESY